jgi:hypothetical protein
MGEVVTKITNTPKSEMRCVANWLVVWVTGRWPQLIGQWEIANWEWFVNHFAGYSLEVDHPEGFEQYRSGGFDRLLVPFRGTPTLDDITTNGTRAPYVLQETVQVAPGQATAYLEALSAAADRIAGAGRGMRLHGSYTVLLRNESEVLVQWALDDLHVFAATVEQPDAFPELAAWREQSAVMERAHAGVLLRPTDWSPLR